MPFYYPYFIVSRWRYLARYGWMIVIESVATVVVVIVIGIQAPRETAEERSSRVHDDNLRLLEKSLERSGLADSLGKKSTSSVPSVSAKPPMSQAESDQVIAKIEAEFEKSRQDMLARFAANRGQPGSPNSSATNQPVFPAAEVRPRSRTTNEIESISRLASDGDKFTGKQKVLVLWGSQWWECEIVNATNSKKPKIHYLGWGTGSDEQVSLDRVRIPTSP